MLTVICALGAAFCNASWAVMARLAGVAAPEGRIAMADGVVPGSPAGLAGGTSVRGRRVRAQRGGAVLRCAGGRAADSGRGADLCSRAARVSPARCHPGEVLVRGRPGLLGARGVFGHRPLPRWHAHPEGDGVGGGYSGVGLGRGRLGGSSGGVGLPPGGRAASAPPPQWCGRWTPVLSNSSPRFCNITASWGRLTTGRSTRWWSAGFWARFSPRPPSTPARCRPLSPRC